MSDGDRVNGSGVFTHGVGLGGGSDNSIYYFYTLGDLAEDDVVFRKIIVLVHDEELRAVGIGARVGHGNSATGVFTSERFVCKFIAWSASAGASRITALDHETVNGAVEDGVVVEIIFG